MARTFTYTPEELANLATQYLDKCKEQNLIPLLQEFGTEIGLDSDTLSRYLHDDSVKQYSEPLKKIKSASESGLVRGVVSENKPIGKMFILKANHGYVEKQHVTHSGTLNMAMILDQLEGKSTRELKEGEDYQVLDQLE